MLKTLKNFNFKELIYSPTNFRYDKFKFNCSNLIDNKVSNVSRDNKFYILNNFKSSTLKDVYDKQIYLARIYSKFQRLRNKTVLNPIPEDEIKNLNKSFENEFDLIKDSKYLKEKILNFLLDKNLALKIENKKDNIEYFLNLENKEVLADIEKENLSLKKFWSKEILYQQKKLLGRKETVNVKFNIVNEIDGFNEEISISIPNPEYMFGITFITIKSNNSELIAKLKIKKYLENSKASFILPTKIFAINPMNEEKIKILILNNNHCLNDKLDSNLRASIPGHNHFDFNLAKENSLPIKFVAKPVHQMVEEVVKKEDKAHLDLNYYNKSIGQIKNEINLKKLSEGPVVLDNMTEGFLINCKEFDFLYMEEAKELIVNYLKMKGKAYLNVRYNLNNIKIASSNGNEIKYESSFEDSLFNLISLFQSKKEINDIVNIFKTWLPADLYITSPEDKSLFITRFIHKTLVNHFLSEMSNFPKKSENEFIDEEVITSKAQELEKDIFFPGPYKKIFNLNSNLQGKIGIMKENVSKLIEDFEVISNIIVNKCKNANFEVDKLRDEIINLNEEKELVTNLFKNTIKIIDNLEEVHLEKLEESIAILRDSLSIKIKNIDLLKKNYNFLVYTYMNHLLILYLFDCEKANLLYRKIMNDNLSKFFRQSLLEYSLDKLYGTCTFFIEMLNNSKRLEVYINDKFIGKIIVDKIAIEIKDKINPLEHILEGLNVDLKKEDVKEFNLNDTQLKITTDKIFKLI